MPVRHLQSFNVKSDPRIEDDAGPPCVNPPHMQVVLDAGEALGRLDQEFDIPLCRCPTRRPSPLHA